MSDSYSRISGIFSQKVCCFCKRTDTLSLPVFLIICIVCCSGKAIVNANSVGSSLVIQFQNIISSAWLGNDTILNLQDFKSVLGGLHAQFRDCRQVSFQ